MHRIDRPAEEPRLMREYREAHRGSRDWEAFRGTAAYGEAKDALIANQHGICAYCETRLSADRTKVRIEHFHPKSDVADPHNWTLDWRNFMAVCMGGTNVPDRSSVYGELHCDASKGSDPTPILNPYEMPPELLFKLTERNELVPDVDICGRVGVAGAEGRSTLELVENTIRVLNLNCRELRGVRFALRRAYEDERRRLRNDPSTHRSIRQIISENWFAGGRRPSLWTTRRLLLGL